MTCQERASVLQDAKYAKNYEVRASSRISYRRRRKPLLFKITLQNLDWRSDYQHFNNFENYLQI